VDIGQVSEPSDSRLFRQVPHAKILPFLSKNDFVFCRFEQKAQRGLRGECLLAKQLF